MNLLDIAMGYGDKPKKLPTRQPMWMQGATAPSISTSVAKVPVGRPTTYDDSNPQAYKYFGTNGAIKTDWSRENDVRYNAKVDNELKARYDNQGLAQLGKFAGSIISDPLAFGVSAYDFMQDPSWLNAGALGLDAFTPGNVGGLLKGLGEVGIAGAAAREFAKKGVGRVVTNLIEPEGYGNKFKDLIQLNNTKGLKKMASSVFNDVPIYNDNIVRLPDREFPYRTMFGLNPREIEITQFNKYPGKDLHRFKTAKVDGDPTRISHLGDYPLPTKQADGTYTVDKNSRAYKTLIDEFLPLNSLQNYDWTKEFTIGGLQNPLFGGFSMKHSPEKRNFTAIDDWDYDLHPGEFKEAMKIAAQGLVAKQGVNAFTPLISDILRFAMSKITDPVKYRVPVSIDELKHSDELNKIIGNQYLQKWGREPVR